MKHFTIAFALSFIPAIAFSQSDVLDLSFSVDGRLITPEQNMTSPVITGDHKIIYINYTEPDPAYSQTRLQINEDGTYDESIGEDGMQHLQLYDLPEPYCTYGGVNFMLQQADGKLIIAGFWMPDADLNESYFIARYNEDGTKDITFGEEGVVKIFDGGNHLLTALHLQDDGKLILSLKEWTSSDYTVSIVRLDTDGNYDETFAADGIFSMGEFYSGNDLAIERIFTNEEGSVYCSAQRSIGEMHDLRLLKFTGSGEKDITFGSEGSVTVFSEENIWYSASCIKLDGDNIIFIATLPDDHILKVAHLNADGSYDISFSSDGMNTISISDLDPDNILSYSGSALIDVSNNIYYEWLNSDLTQITIAKFLENGNADISFSHDGKTEIIFDDKIWKMPDMAFDGSNKIVITAGLINDSGAASFETCRIFTDGTLTSADDPEFEKAISIYPDPASAYITIPSCLTEKEGILLIKDAGGKTVIKCETGNSENMLIDLKHLGTGLYHVVITSPEFRYTSSFVKL